MSHPQLQLSGLIMTIESVTDNHDREAVSVNILTAKSQMYDIMDSVFLLGKTFLKIFSSSAEKMNT